MLSRGIDVPMVTHVIVHDLGSVEEYCHRVGRTGRGEHGKGNALVMFEYWEKAPYNAELLADVLERSNQIVPAELLKIKDDVKNGRRRANHQIREWDKTSQGLLAYLKRVRARRGEEVEDQGAGDDAADNSGGGGSFAPASRAGGGGSGGWGSSSSQSKNSGGAWGSKSGDKWGSSDSKDQWGSSSGGNSWGGSSKSNTWGSSGSKHEGRSGGWGNSSGSSENKWGSGGGGGSWGSKSGW